MSDITTRLIFDDTQAVQGAQNYKKELTEINEQTKEVETNTQKAYANMAEAAAGADDAVEDLNTSLGAQATASSAAATAAGRQSVANRGVTATSRTATAATTAQTASTNRLTVAMNRFTASSSGRFSGALGQLASRFGAVGAGAAAAATAVGLFFANFISRNQQRLDTFRDSISGLGSVWENFRDALAGEAELNIFGSLAEGTRNARTLREATRAYAQSRVDIARITAEIAEQRAILADEDSSLEARREALAQYNTLIDDLAVALGATERLAEATAAGLDEAFTDLDSEEFAAYLQLLVEVENSVARVSNERRTFAREERRLNRENKKDKTEEKDDTEDQIKLERQLLDLEIQRRRLQEDLAFDIRLADPGITELDKAIIELERSKIALEREIEDLTIQFERTPAELQDSAAFAAIREEYRTLVDALIKEIERLQSEGLGFLVDDPEGGFSTPDDAPDRLGIALQSLDALGDAFSNYVDRRIADSQRLIDSLRELRDAQEDDLEEQLERRERGLSNNVLATERALQETTRLEREAFEEQQRLRRQQVATEFLVFGARTVAQAANTPFPGNIPAIIAAVALVFSTIQQLRGLSTESFSEGGFIGKPGTRWRSDRYGKGHRIEGSNVVVGGDEFVINGRTTQLQRGFIEDLNAGHFDHINLAELAKDGFRSRDTVLNQRQAAYNQRALNRAMSRAMSQHTDGVVSYMKKQKKIVAIPPGAKILEYNDKERTTTKYN